MIYKVQLRELITDVLKSIDLYSEDAVELLMLTAAVESKLGTYIKQLKGPARGIFQMEPNTERDIWENYLKYKPELFRKISRFVYADGVRDDLDLTANIPYQIAMARVHYLRRPDKLPTKEDIKSLAEYWKKHYNTYKGKGTVDKAVKAYEICCG